jgi:PrgI family protein
MPTGNETEPDAPTRERMPADVDAPDKVVYGLTFRQLAILAVAGMLFYGAWNLLRQVLPLPVLLGGAVVLGGVAFGLAVGRRDGLPMDTWLLHAIKHRRAPKALSTVDMAADIPDWVDQAATAPVVLPAPLKLPADAIDDDGHISLGASSAAMVATTTVNLALRTPDEQTALVEGFGRWLNSLNTPTQILVSAQPVDLASHAQAMANAATTLAHPALAAACADHAAFLADLATRRDPLRRQVLVVTRTVPGEAGGHTARRRADDTARALSGLGVNVRALDASAVTAALAAAADPYTPPRAGRRAAPHTTITAPPARSRTSRQGKRP